jgi:cobalt-zinc-cadmium efflux system outer membrane protein
MNFLRAIALLALLSNVPRLNAEPAPVITLSSLSRLVRSQNPDLAAARLLIDEATGSSKQSGLLENPDLEFATNYNGTSGERGIEIGVSQKFPVTHRLALEKNRGASGIEAARQEILEVENRLIGEAKAATVRVLGLRARKDLIEKQSVLSRELADFISAAADRGEASPIDVGQARLDVLRFTTESSQLDAEERRILGELKPLIGMKPGDPVHISGSLPDLRLPDGADAVKRPALEVARLAVIAAEQDAAIEQTKRYGDMSAGVFAAAERNIDEPVGADHEAIVGLRLIIPLPFWNKNEGNIEAAEARAERRRKEVSALNRHILLEAESTRAEMLEWAKLAAEITTTLLPQADEQTDLAEKAWREGQSDLLTVFRAREQRLQLAATRLDALQNFHLARVRHETALGNP